jgi:hypothetical protein
MKWITYFWNILCHVKSTILIALSVRPSVEVLKVEVLSVRPFVCRGLETRIGTRLSVSLSRSWNTNRDPSVRLSVEVLKPRSGPVCPSLCWGPETQIMTRLSVSLLRSWNSNHDPSVRLSIVHVRFRAATVVVNVASNPPPLQFVPEISKLPRMLQQLVGSGTLQAPVDASVASWFRKSPSSRRCFSSQLIATTGARCGVCLDFCFTLILCFLFAPSFTVVEISSYVLESTVACASPIKYHQV